MAAVSIGSAVNCLSGRYSQRDECEFAAPGRPVIFLRFLSRYTVGRLCQMSREDKYCRTVRMSDCSNWNP